MAIIKAYTDISQSKKLAEILPLETADMYYFLDPTPAGNIYHIVISRVDFGVKTREPEYDKGDIPCWSLAALFRVLPNPKVYQAIGGHWCCECWKNPKDVKNDESTYISCTKANNPVDACYEMIIRLNELNLL